MCLGCRFSPRLGRGREVTAWCFSLTLMFLSLPLSFLSSLSKIDKHVLGWGWKKNLLQIKKKKNTASNTEGVSKKKEKFEGGFCFCFLRINSKVNFYFYNKRQSKLHETHVKGIMEWASSRAWLCKACESGGSGKAVLFLGGLAWPAALKEEASRVPVAPDLCWLQLSPANSNPANGQSTLRAGWGGAAALSRWRASSVAQSDGTCWQVTMEFQMDILALALSAVTSTSCKMAAGRTANLWPQEPVWWEIPWIRAVSSGWRAIPWDGHRPDSAGFSQAGRTKLEFSHTHRCWVAI